MSKVGMPSYQFWVEQGNRWKECVDYASLPSSWTPEMFEILKTYDNDYVLASAELCRRKSERYRHD